MSDYERGVRDGREAERKAVVTYLLQEHAEMDAFAAQLRKGAWEDVLRADAIDTACEVVDELSGEIAGGVHLASNGTKTAPDTTEAR